MKKAITVCIVLIMAVTLVSAACADGKLTFRGVDSEGNVCTESMLKDSRVILFNRWEPWCAPCRSELPALGELYEEYRDDGFMIIGAYTYTQSASYTLNMTAGELLDEAGCSYPNIIVDDAFNPFNVPFVPYSFLMNSEGEILPLNQECKDAFVEESIAGEKEFIGSFMRRYENGDFNRYLDDPDLAAELGECLDICSSEESKAEYLDQCRKEVLVQLGEYLDNNIIPGSTTIDVYQCWIESAFED